MAKMPKPRIEGARKVSEPEETRVQAPVAPAETEEAAVAPAEDATAIESAAPEGERTEAAASKLKDSAESPAAAPKRRAHKDKARRRQATIAVETQGAAEASSAPVGEDGTATEASVSTTSTDVEEPVPAAPKQGALGWLSRSFPGHENAVLGGAVGLLVALAVFVCGFWQTLFVSLLVVAGIAFGQYLDGNPKIFNLLRRLAELLRGGDNE